MRLLNFFVVVILFLNFIPSIADCGGEPNDIDKDCVTKCVEAQREPKFKEGCYLPPETKTCEDYKYKPHPEEQLCCCK